MILVVLIALAIILYLMFGMNGGGSGGGGGSKGTYMGQMSTTRKQSKAMAQDISTQQLSILIAQYRQEHDGKLPASAADLDNNAAFTDPWGGPITFKFEEPKRGAAGAGGTTKVIYHSNGPDGQPGTDDDMNKTDTLPF